jgi:Flp pilus assembly protein TadD
LLGLLAFHATNFDAAIGLISRAIELSPINAAYHHNLGVVPRDAGRLAESAAPYHEAIRLDPRHVDANVNLAVVLTELQRPEEALATRFSSTATRRRSVAMGE